MAGVQGDTCIGLLAFAVNSISSSKPPTKYNFEISQVVDTIILSHQFSFIIGYSFMSFIFVWLVVVLMIKIKNICENI